MSKILALLAGIIIIAIVIFSLFGGLGFNLGSSSGDSESESKGNDESEAETEFVENSNDDTKSSLEATSEKNNISVSVVKNAYFYDNRSIKLDDFVKIIEKHEGTFVVEVTDDNASLKAYRKLIDELEKREISYLEKIDN